MILLGMGNQRQATKHMDRQLEIAWAAGFVDGEGCVRIRVLNNRRLGKISYSLALSAAQVERDPLERLKRLFGGSISLTVRCLKGNQSPYYQFIVTGSSAASAFAEMLPHLTVKKERAQLALEFQKHVKKGRSKLTDPITQQEWTRREDLYLRMRFLNLPLALRRAAAETKSESQEQPEVSGSDSPACIDSKDAETNRNDSSAKVH